MEMEKELLLLVKINRIIKKLSEKEKEIKNKLVENGFRKDRIEWRNEVYEIKRRNGKTSCSILANQIEKEDWEKLKSTSLKINFKEIEKLIDVDKEKYKNKIKIVSYKDTIVINKK